jgi:uncharacterized membrane protein YjfL (UPF0719 family)
MKIKQVLLITGLCSAFIPNVAFAAVNGLNIDSLINGVISTLIYGILGIIMASLGYKVVDLLTPGDLSKDIVEGKNQALATLASSMVLGICIIIAAVLVG